MEMLSEILATALLIGVASVESLLPYQIYAEGSCANLHEGPVKNVNPIAQFEFVYMAADSKYNFLRQLSVHPKYSQITSQEFFQCACMKLNYTSINPVTLTVEGFGVPLVTYEVEVKNVGEGEVAFDVIPINKFNRGDVLKEFVTLTDGQNFSMSLQCWTGTNLDQKSWSVLSRTRILDESAKIAVLEHVRKLGFSEDNAVFFESEYCDSCSYYNEYVKY